MFTFASYKYRIVKSEAVVKNGVLLIEDATMTSHKIKLTLVSAIPAIVCAVALAISFWVVSATEARAERAHETIYHST